MSRRLLKNRKGCARPGQIVRLVILRTSSVTGSQFVFKPSQIRLMIALAKIRGFLHSITCVNVQELQSQLIVTLVIAIDVCRAGSHSCK